MSESQGLRFSLPTTRVTLQLLASLEPPLSLPLSPVLPLITCLSLSLSSKYLTPVEVDKIIVKSNIDVLTFDLEVPPNAVAYNGNGLKTTLSSLQYAILLLRLDMATKLVACNMTFTDTKSCRISCGVLDDRIVGFVSADYRVCVAPDDNARLCTTPSYLAN